MEGDPITLTIERGMVADIAGDGLGAELLRSFMAGFDDPRAYAISHIGWGLDGNANEAKQGFLLNHLIREELPPTADGDHLSNSDPVTGQAGWYDVRVRIYPAGAEEPEVSSPQFDTLHPVPGQLVSNNPGRWLKYLAGKK